MNNNSKKIISNSGIEFYKMQASGNDFILLDLIKKNKFSNLKYKGFAQKYCSRKHSIGADGLLIMEPTQIADMKMRIFNSDGSEAEMCGNGARCAALWASKIKLKSKNSDRIIRFDTKAGIIESKIIGTPVQSANPGNSIVKIKMADPFDIKFMIAIKVLGRDLKVNFLNTGVPHAVVFVQDLDGVDVDRIGRAIRRHKQFEPKGTNVDFIEIVKNDLINIRTYERGVEGETLACGTGAVACAVVAWFMTHGVWKKGKKVLRVRVKSGEILKVSFEVANDRVNSIWFEGRAYCIYKGVLT